MAGWFPCDFSRDDVFLIVTRRAKHEQSCPESDPRTRMCPFQVEGKDPMTAAMERVKRETDYTAAKKR